MKFKLSGRGGGFAQPSSEETLLAAADSTQLDALARVAEEHAPDGGYGETAWNAGTKTVFWISADWSSNEEVDAAEEAFLAVDGVAKFEYEAEAALPEGDGWETVWTSSVAGETASVSPADRWDALAREIEAEIEQEPVTASAARGHDPMWGVLRLAAEEVETARLREAEALASRSREDRGAMREMFAAIRHLADRKPGDTHITMPATELHPHVTIHEPPITVEAAATPDVNVSVEPAQVTVEAAPTPTVEFRPEITVQPPNVEAPNVEVAAPEVHVTVEQPPRPGAVRAIKEDDGSTVFTVEPEYEEE